MGVKSGTAAYRVDWEKNSPDTIASIKVTCTYVSCSCRFTKQRRYQSLRKNDSLEPSLCSVAISAPFVQLLEPQQWIPKGLLPSGSSKSNQQEENNTSSTMSNRTSKHIVVDEFYPLVLDRIRLTPDHFWIIRSDHLRRSAVR